MNGQVISLAGPWSIGERLDGGGFGQVYEASGEASDAVAKFVPKALGADRELLFVDLDGVRNVIPIIDSGEHLDDWVLVMPRADRSLRNHLDAAGGSLDVAETVDILKDICDALVDLDGRVVHRDLKPANILLLEGRWCLADFGISRYAEATTAPDTQKFAMSPPYAAPERWRGERATSAADVYAVGIIAFEMLTGARPFAGPSQEDYREAHLHADPAHIDEVPASLGALIDECLFKAPESRPGPANLRARLEKVATPAASPGLSSLQEANRAEVLRRQEEERQESVKRSEAERRAEIENAGARLFSRLASSLRSALLEAAPSIEELETRTTTWSVGLGAATLTLTKTRRVDGREDWPLDQGVPFDVVSSAAIGIQQPSNHYGYEGRSHSLWYCDAQEPGQFAWFETAFMHSAFTATRGNTAPFALHPGRDAAQAVMPMMGTTQVAWPFTPLMVGDLDELIDRWASWLAAASTGSLQLPGSMPERDPAGSWRRN